MKSCWPGKTSLLPTGGGLRFGPCSASQAWKSSVVVRSSLLMARPPVVSGDGLDLDRQAIRVRQLADGDGGAGGGGVGEVLRGVRGVVGGEVGHVDEVGR